MTEDVEGVQGDVSGSCALHSKRLNSGVDMPDLVRSTTWLMQGYSLGPLKDSVY